MFTSVEKLKRSIPRTPYSHRCCTKLLEKKSFSY